jgi:alpha-amylase/alpha-mannosidase (GH57 family)
MHRYVCIHGHFYQPPRENPWLEEIEIQDEAYPFHDWNERITEECYGPNAASRILDAEGRILEIVNNYSHISFNFGPTLLSWMERHHPDLHRAIVEADELSKTWFEGHGSALAQVYNHTIMPLTNDRDKQTQVIWGVRDFRHRFGRDPKGMWLAETAVDVPTLEALAEQGIRFTILEPGQAARIRPLGGDDNSWIDVGGGKIDPRQPYRAVLPSGKTIDLFFYDGPASRAVAFENLLESGERFAHRLLDLLDDEPEQHQLANIATDGESYGHHHRFGDMALAWALRYIEEQGNATLVNYSRYLEINPPEFEVEIVENTSWSCAHGIERWRSGCGCGAPDQPDWNTDWRGPLRDALDYLRDTIAGPWEEMAGRLFADPWHARNEYIEIILDRSRAQVDRVLGELAGRELDQDETVRGLKLLELQRQALLMYTSCGWFFEDVSRIETRQVLAYAARAIQLAEDLFEMSLEEPFLEILSGAVSNIPGQGTGADVYRTHVRPMVVDLPAVAAHYAMTSLFNDEEEAGSIYSYDVENLQRETATSGRSRLALGRVRLTSRITREVEEMSYAVLHLGDHNLDGGVRRFQGQEAFDRMVADVGGAFRRADYSDTIRALDRHFDDHSYSLRSLFRDEQRRILDEVMDSTLSEVERTYRAVYEDNQSLIRFLVNLGAPVPGSLKLAAEVVVNTELRRAFRSGDLEFDEIVELVEETRNWGITLDEEGLGFVLEHTIERMASQFRRHPLRVAHLERLHTMVKLAATMPFQVDLRKPQNDFYRVVQETYPGMQERAAAGDLSAKRWVNEFQALGEALSVHVG